MKCSTNFKRGKCDDNVIAASGVTFFQSLLEDFLSALGSMRQKLAVEVKWQWFSIDGVIDRLQS